MRQKARLGSTAIPFLFVLAIISMATPFYAAGAETVLLSFPATGPGGNYPYSTLVFDSAGNLYGTTSSGGATGGVVFKLVPTPSGPWTENVLAYGVNSAAGLTFDAAGNLYGTNTSSIFELSPSPSGTWTAQTIYNFTAGGTEPFALWAGVTFDASGNLYGTSYYGGEPGGCGAGDGCDTVYQLTPGPNNTWSESVLHSFSNIGVDGYYLRAGVTLDAEGNL
jgi:hypothetical protein